MGVQLEFGLLAVVKFAIMNDLLIEHKLFTEKKWIPLIGSDNIQIDLFHSLKTNILGCEYYKVAKSSPYPYISGI